MRTLVYWKTANMQQITSWMPIHQSNYIQKCYLDEDPAGIHGQRLDKSLHIIDITVIRPASLLQRTRQQDLIESAMIPIKNKLK